MSSGNSTKKDVPADHRLVFDQLKKRTGLTFPDIRLVEISAFMEQEAKSRNLSLADYSAHLAFDNALFDELCNKVTIAETYFFRDPRQFDYVKKQVIPAWKAKHNSRPVSVRGTSEKFRLLSAGCSTGEEAYSLAILLDQEGLGEQMQIHGTDLSKLALAQAEKAEYGPWSLRISDQNFCNRNFDQEDGRYKLKKKHASRVQFMHLNLLDDQSLFADHGIANLDLIFCRNVLIYFEPAAIAGALTTLHCLLKPGGHLVLGPSDPPANQYADFQPVVCDWGVFYKKTEMSDNSSIDSAVGHAQTGQSQTPPAVVRSLQIIRPDLPKHSTPHRKHQAPANKLPQSKEQNPGELLGQAQTAFDRGQYEKAFNLTGKNLDDPAAATLHIRALANFSGSAPAEKLLKKLVKQHLSSFQLQYLHGHLLMDLGQSEEAMEALKRCLFLDCKATMAHFSLALVQKRLLDKAGAQRSFRNVIELCKNQPPDEILPYGDGERVKILAVQAAAELEALSQI